MSALHASGSFVGTQHVRTGPRSRNQSDARNRPCRRSRRAVKTVGLRLDQYLVALFPDFSRSLLQKAIEADGVTAQRRTRPRRATRSASATASASGSPSRTGPTRSPRTSRSTSSTRTSSSPSSTSRPTWSSTPPRATGPARWSTPCAFHFSELSKAQRRLPARHRPPPRPRHQRRHPHRQGGADAPRPEHAVRDAQGLQGVRRHHRRRARPRQRLHRAAASATTRTTASR